MRTRLIKLYRSIILVALFVLFGIGALFLRYFIFPFQKDKKESYTTLQKSWKFLINLMESLNIIKLHVNDSDKIKNIKNSIIVSTHPSFMDIIILMSLIPYSTCFVAKKLAKNPILKGMVKYLFILDDENFNKSIDTTCEKLEDGMNVIIFPMGTRHRKNEYPKIRRGAALLAYKSKKNISLINMETSFDFLQINQPFYDAGETHVDYTIDYLGELNCTDYLTEENDEVSFKTRLTKDISNILYKDKI